MKKGTVLEDLRLLVLTLKHPVLAVYLSLGAKTALDDRPVTGSTNTVTVSVSDNGQIQPPVSISIDDLNCQTQLKLLNLMRDELVYWLGMPLRLL